MTSYLFGDALYKKLNKYKDNLHLKQRCRLSLEYNEVELTQKVLNDADLVFIITDYKKYNYNFIQENSKFIFDKRNETKSVENRENIELL